jgi:hypothetical protein
MSFLKSILFGCEGSYNIFGTQVEFESELPSHLIPPNLKGVGLISQLAFKCVQSNAFRWVTQGYAHVFVHEMSHALAFKILTGKNSKVIFFTKLLLGRNIWPPEVENLVDWKRTVINVAGPMGNIAFSTCKLIAATALKSYLYWPVSLALGSGAVIWISGELFYAYVSASKNDTGDFGCIARRSNTHLALASTVIVNQLALGTFLVIK